MTKSRRNFLRGASAMVATAAAVPFAKMSPENMPLAGLKKPDGILFVSNPSSGSYEEFFKEFLKKGADGAGLEYEVMAGECKKIELDEKCRWADHQWPKSIEFDGTLSEISTTPEFDALIKVSGRQSGKTHKSKLFISDDTDDETA